MALGLHLLQSGPCELHAWDLLPPPPQPGSCGLVAFLLLVIQAASMSPLGFLALSQPVLNSFSKPQGGDSVFMVECYIVHLEIFTHSIV